MSTFALEQINAQLPDALTERFFDRTGAAWGVVRPDRIREVAALLKERLGFRLFLCMDAVDRLLLPPEEQNPRFEVVYFFRNVERNDSIRLKVRVNDGEEVDSIRPVFQGADWAERLVWDFYGIPFRGHGDLRRMLTYEEFKGHPLRKDYPLRGRQPLLKERPLQDVIRGPGTNRA